MFIVMCEKADGQCVVSVLRTKDVFYQRIISTKSILDRIEIWELADLCWHKSLSRQAICIWPIVVDVGLFIDMQSETAVSAIKNQT
jgi:hypothetical protein